MMKEMKKVSKDSRGDWTYDTVFIAWRVDLSRVGGPMGEEQTSEEVIGVFAELTKAQHFCERRAKKDTTETLCWGVIEEGNCLIYSETQDLGPSMYTIREMEVR